VPRPPRHTPPFGRLGRLATPDGFRRTAIALVILLWAVIPSGAAVRLTGSGLGCDAWPHCEEGSLVPALDAHAWIEFTNRLFSGGVIVFAIVVWVAAWRLPDRPRGLLGPALAALAATIGQIPLGAVTVEFDLHPVLVGSHFLLSIAALAAGTVLALRAHDHARAIARDRDRRRGALARLTAAALGTAIVSGVLVTASGPHSGDRGVIDRIWALDEAAYVHVRVVIAFVCLAVLTAVVVVRDGRRGRVIDPVVRRLGAATIPLVGVQVALGEIQYRNQLPWQVILAHVSLAGLLWVAALVVAWRLARPVAGQDRRSARDWQGTHLSASGSASNRRSGIASPQSTHTP
jgi:cytochrome c oxidase assembly protein subunit 15